MARITSTQITCRAVPLALLICLAALALGQTPTTAPEKKTGVIRLRVRVGEGAKAKGLSRKRFFLIKGTKAQNKALIDSFEQRALTSRDCYYRGIGASEALIKWLKQGDGCESVYCREIETADIDGPNAVPEFQKAVSVGEKEYGSRELARKWLAPNLPENIVSGFYKQQTKDLLNFLEQSKKSPKEPTLSAMTDLNGTAYFVRLETGKYTISSILPIEVGAKALYWNCDFEVKPGDLATEKPFLISNSGNKDPRDIKNIKCVAEEKPLPACPATPK